MMKSWYNLVTVDWYIKINIKLIDIDWINRKLISVSQTIQEQAKKKKRKSKSIYSFKFKVKKQRLVLKKKEKNLHWVFFVFSLQTL